MYLQAVGEVAVVRRFVRQPPTPTHTLSQGVEQHTQQRVLLPQNMGKSGMPLTWGMGPLSIRNGISDWPSAAMCGAMVEAREPMAPAAG
jgi:hypothetical protein